MKPNRLFIHVLLYIAIASALPLCAFGQSGTVMLNKWGEFGNKPGQFKYPAMIAVDTSSSAVYVVDQHNHRIQKFDQDGNFILMWGKPGSNAGEFNYPYGIAIDSKGNVYVSDTNNNRIQKFSSEGIYIGATGSYGNAAGQFKYPYGIAIDKHDDLYVIDASNYRIQKISARLEYITSWGTQESLGIKLYMPHDIAITLDDAVLLSDRQNHRLSFFSKDGKLLKRLGEYGEGKNLKGGQFSEPHGIAVSATGDFFIADRYNFRVQKFDAKGKYQTQWLTSGNFDDSRHFPLGLATGTAGRVFLSDHYSHTIYSYRL